MSPTVSELTSLSLAQARDGLKKKSFSAAELTAAHQAVIEKARALNAFVLETPERAGEMAKASDVRIAQGKAGPLEGIPLAVKDMFCTTGVRSTACSHILDNFIPTYESTVTSQLWRDGAVLLGKTNCDEFAMGSSNETSYFGAVHSRGGGRAQTRRLRLAVRPEDRLPPLRRSCVLVRPARTPAVRSASRPPLPELSA